MSDCYNFNHTKRGIAVVAVNVECTGFKPRTGAEKDIELLFDCFKSLRFDVRVLSNYKGDQLVTELKNIAKEMTMDPDFDCFVFAMSSHGDKKLTYRGNHTIEEDVILASDASRIPTQTILELFSDENCEGLIGKPRLFFLQACRGNLVDDGCDVVDGPSGTCDNMLITPLPCLKDYLVMYAGPPGFYAFRNKDRGSWFIIELCGVLQKADSHRPNILKHLRHVTKCVGRSFESKCSGNPEYDAKKQSPVIYSMLVKDILFN